MQSNNAGVLAGATDVLVENNRLRLPTTSSTTAPAAGGALIIGRLDTAGRTVPAFIAQDGVVRDIQSALTRSSPMIWKAQHAGTTLSVPGGVAPTVVGTATAFTIATTNLVTYTPRLDYLVTVAATTAIAGFRGAVAHVTVGGPGAGLGGCRTGRVHLCRALGGLHRGGQHHQPGLLRTGGDPQRANRCRAFDGRAIA